MSVCSLVHSGLQANQGVLETYLQQLFSICANIVLPAASQEPTVTDDLDRHVSYKLVCGTSCVHPALDSALHDTLTVSSKRIARDSECNAAMGMK